MTALALDTATERATLVLFNKSTVLTYEELAFGFMHSRSLITSLSALFERANCRPDELSYIAVGVGPGSYTGIRVGVACAKALSYAHKLPLIGISSLAPFCPETACEGAFLAAMDAKVGGIYVRKGDVKAGRVMYATEDELVPLEQFAEALSAVRYVVTPSWQPLRERLAEMTTYPEVIERYPSCEMMVEEAERLYTEEKYVVDGSIKIRYFRAVT